MTTDELVTNLWSHRSEIYNGVSIDRLTILSGAKSPFECLKLSNKAVLKGNMVSRIDPRTGKMHIRLFKL